MTNKSFEINGMEIKPGERLTIDLPVTKLYTHTPVAIPVHIINGKKPGPRLFVSAAIHGDELNGVEIIRRLLKQSALKRLRGTLVAIPVVNVHGFINQSRYLPDRRDLNRSFPGSAKGSLAARLAHLFMTEIVSQCTHGIDLHTGAVHRDNLPQIRANLDDADTNALAKAFSVPVILNSNLRDGSLRESAAEMGIPMLLYEVGEALRFDEIGIRAGVRGIINVMRTLGMLPPSSREKKRVLEPIIARSSLWIRASASGVVRHSMRLGDKVSENGTLGVIADPFGGTEIEITSSCAGIIIGCAKLPLANEGDALFHIARFGQLDKVVKQVEEFQDIHNPDT
jgi:predicted deacylase